MKEVVRIYTKAGDEGRTSIGTGESIFKNDIRLTFLGTVDELNSLLGIVCSYCENNALLLNILSTVQNQLLGIGADIAFCCQKKVNISEEHVQFLEQTIDNASIQLAPLKNLIIPGGNVVAAHLHLARAVARRAERYGYDLMEFYQKQQKQPRSFKDILVYLNRLSDTLFILSRHANNLGKDDIVWHASPKGQL